MLDNIELSLSSSLDHFLQEKARQHKREEIMGVLLTQPGERIITSTVLLPANATGASAECRPETLVWVLDYVTQQGRVPVGLVHSHGGNGRHGMGVFHSGTDEAMIRHALPTLARLEKAHHPRVPYVMSRCEAILPCENGEQMRLRLLGPRLGDVHQAARWSSAETRFCKSRNDTPAAVLTANTLVLAAHGVELCLGIPLGATVVQSTELTTRTLHAFSLVINGEDRFAECLVIVQTADGDEHISKRPCSVVITPDDFMQDRLPTANRNFISYAVTDDGGHGAVLEVRGCQNGTYN